MVTPESTMLMSDEIVVKKTLVERSYFGLLVSRYEEKLIRYIRRLGIRNNEDQQDVIQEIFIKVYKNLNGFDSKLPFSSWIYRIAHNEAVSFYRKQKVRPEGHLATDAEELLLFVPDKNSSVEQVLDMSISAEILSVSLSKLEAKYRDPIILRFFENKEYEEISDILKIPIGTVGTLISRGKKRLEELLPKEMFAK